MNKIIISALTALAISATSLSAMELFVDAKGQVFMTGGKGRVSINSKEAKDIKENLIAHPELTAPKKEDTAVFAHASKLKFSGTHYLGFTHKDYKERASNTHGDSTSAFEMRRNYLQVKAYVLEDPKSYVRVTLDATYDPAKASGKADVIVKYAYLYLNNILPATGVELGMVHRPWHDYEQATSWYMRSISKVFMEGTAKFGSSADLGVNFKTKTNYFTSEVGIFNGEGYGGENDVDSSGDKIYVGDGTSLEWRITLAALGNGKKKRKPTKDTFLDASFFGQYNMDNTDNNGETYSFYGLHAVYNMPSFLVAAQYLTAENDSHEAGEKHFNGDGYSVNMTGRFGNKKQFSILGRYDRWESKDLKTDKVVETKDVYIYGAAWQQNKNIKWLATGETYNLKESDSEDYTKGMITAEVKW